MQRQIFVILAAAILAAPVGAATWYSYGTYEPDTIYDYQGSFMQRDPDVTQGAKELYFNAYQTQYLTGTDTNVGALGTRIQEPGVREWIVIMGTWKDCNGDGYVGQAESALVTYQSALLLDASICPPDTEDPLAHNDGTWVFEFIPVGYQYEADPNLHPKQIVDPDSRVWSDIGLPGDGAAATCPIAPPPHGTTAGTGWALRHADCFTGKQIVGAVNTVDSDGSLGLRFEDPNNPQYSDSTLNQHLPESLFGNPATGETGALQLDSDEDDADSNGQSRPERRDYAFTAFDCSGDRTLEVKDPTGLAPSSIVVEDQGAVSGDYGKIDENLTDEDGNYAWVAAASPGEVDPSGSFADGVNHTFMGFRAGGGDENHDTASVGGDCDFEADDEDGDNTYAGTHQTAFFYADGDNEGGTQVAAKNAHDTRFIYSNGAEVEGAEYDAFGATGLPLVTPQTYYLYSNVFATLPSWTANTIWTTTPQSVDRSTAGPAGPSYWTFYGKVGAATLDAGYTPAGGTGVYGSEVCGAAESGIVGGWNCDPDAWFRDSTGDYTGDALWDVPVGATYQFRDIDCNDGELLRGFGIHASLVDVYGEACLDAPGTAKILEG